MHMPKATHFHQHRGTIPIFFREWRQAKRMTQEQVAERMDTNKGRISMKERGEEGWDDAYLAALAEALGLKDPSLLMRNPEDSADPWTVIDSLDDADRAKVLDYAETLRRARKADDPAT